jgi:pilus assembly protein CpaF
VEIATIPAPKTIEEVGVPRNLLEDLALKNLYMVGELSLHQLAGQMGLNLRVVEALFERLRKDQFCEVTGMDGGVHRITTSAAGKSRALELLAQNQYAGPAPVSLEDYVGRVHAQNVRDIQITPDDLKRAFEELVLDTKTLNQLGTAVVSGQALFLYGPSGTGKSIIAQTLARLFEDDQAWVPFAMEVDGQLITVYDPVLHQKVEKPDVFDQDGRWVLCRRPRVLVAGELTSEMLDLQLNPSVKFYTAPVQMKANNGVLIVDDFGRQRVSPEAFLNRWVLPLERRIDFLTLAGGKKVEIPFDLFVIFATNLDPAKTMDNAFLRRIQTKIELGPATTDQFHEICRRACLQFNLNYDGVVVDELIHTIETEYGEKLRPCHPRDILKQILWESRYLQKDPVLDRKSVAKACSNYFISSRPDIAPGAYEGPVEPALTLRSTETRTVIADVVSHGLIRDTPINLGPLAPLMEDKSVADILIDSFDKIYVEKKGKLESTDFRFETEAQLRELIDSILATMGRRVDASLPMADARLPDGSRVNVIIPPLAIDGLSMSIRRFRKDALQLEDMIELKSLTAEIGELLKGIVRARLNVLVSGGTGSGKTTLLNMLSGFIPSNERIVSIEDSAELQLKQEYVVRLETRPPDLEGKGEIVQRDLVRNSLRMRPDRIVVGEVRGAEVLDMLQAMNTGHDGSLSTIHANSPRDAIARLETLVAMCGLSIPAEAIRKQIASAINIIIQVARLGDGGRKLVSLQEITGMEGNVVVMQEFFRFEQTGVTVDGLVKGRFRSGGIRPRFVEKFDALGIKVPGVIFDPRGVIEI